MQSERSLGFHGYRSLLALVLLLAVSAMPVVAQVSPNEILNPDLKALEQNYFQQLIGINQSISKIKFPFPFYLSRYVGLDPAKQAEADSRGLEFVRFQDRVILKVTGNYNAAYDTLRLTQNERAAATFRSIVLPVLQVVTATERDPLNVQTLARSIPAKPDATSSARSSTLASHSALLKPEVPSPVTASPVAASAPVADPAPAKSAPTRGGEQAASPPATDPPPAAPALTQADADRLDERYQAQLAALAREGAAKFHFVAYAPPTFVLFHDQIALQMTLKNSLQFGPAKGSIYKRAAQSFDLFLAQLLKDISERVSPDVEFQLFDFSVLNKLSPTAKETSEAIEFICPRKALKQFVNAEITNQQLLDQSIVLVNGVRIALNLQLVE